MHELKNCETVWPGEKGGREYHDFKIFRRSVPFMEVEESSSDDIPVIENEERELETE